MHRKLAYACMDMEQGERRRGAMDHHTSAIGCCSQHKGAAGVCRAAEPSKIFYLTLAASSPEISPRRLLEASPAPFFGCRPKWHRLMGLGISQFPSQCFLRENILACLASKLYPTSACCSLSALRLKGTATASVPCLVVGRLLLANVSE